MASGSSGVGDHDGLKVDFVLVRPQLGENVGAAARAMWNCGLDRLRIVAPRDGWPNPRALASATGAASVVEAASLHATCSDALRECHHVYATTARERDMTKPAVAPEQLAAEIRAASERGERSAILFGPERTGLDNDEVTLADKIVHIPLNPEFTSLNLAQAVLVMAYELFRLRGVGVSMPRLDRTPATAGELVNFFEHLEQELERGGFFRVAEKKPLMVRNLRNLLRRMDLDEQEVKTLHGVVANLTGRRKDGARIREPNSKRRPSEDRRTPSEDKRD